MTLSCADLRCDELIFIIATLHEKKLSNEEMHNMDFFTRCSYLNLNPVLLVRHFQYRVEKCFKIIVLDGPLHKVKYHAIRIEFQVPGSPHVHSFLWVYDTPVLNAENILEYILFVDSIIKASLPDIETSSDLSDLVVTYQIHSHSKSCGKYKNETCRYNFGNFFTESTIIACPLPSTMAEDSKK